MEFVVSILVDNLDSPISDSVIGLPCTRLTGYCYCRYGMLSDMPKAKADISEFALA
jgi:hypothetical protein